MDLTVERVERHPVEVPFREVPARNMDRQLPHWRYFELVEVELASGHVGVGENMLYYGWGEFGDEEVEHVSGENAADLLWDDSLGGIQLALFDAVARALDVPIHALLGEQVQDRVPVAWWCIDMSPEDWVAECRRAWEAGYTHAKLKGRPWFDVWEQAETLDVELPEEMRLGIDFNATLLDADRAIPVLRDLDAYERIEIFETPIPHGDVEGNRRIADAVEADIAHHYGAGQPARVQLAEGLCDGFVLGTGGTDRLLDEGAVCAMADRPCWMQQVGTGITAAFSAHCAAVLPAARWPAVNCHQLYEHDLLVESMPVADGTTPVPEGPGLGYAIDWDAVERFAIERPEERPSPPRLTETEYPDGRTMYARGEDIQTLAAEGETPYYERGVTTRLLRDDGSDRFERLHERCAGGPVIKS